MWAVLDKVGRKARAQRAPQVEEAPPVALVEIKASAQ
jgi:hypothetical protein